MTPERAAQVLGVSVDASAADIERAFHRRARLTHPDVSAHPDAPAAGRDAGEVDAGAGFREAIQARQVLLRPHVGVPRAVIDDVDRDGRPLPRVQGPRLLAVWAGLLMLAAFLAIFRADLPFTLAEPVARWAVLLVAAIAYGATGRRPFLVIAIVAEVVTVLLTVGFASLGGLLALLITLPALLGAFTGGLARERVRRLAVG